LEERSVAARAASPALQIPGSRINDTPLSEALNAIGQRLELPFIFDHNALAREGIDIDSEKVSLPPGRTYYMRIITRLLSQAKLTSDLRVDEAGRPFLWITSIRKE
jgi:hypothetical protein